MHRSLLLIVLIIALVVSAVNWIATAHELHRLRSSLRHLEVNTATISVVDSTTGEQREVLFGTGWRTEGQVFPKSRIGGPPDTRELTWVAVEPWTVRVKTPTSEWTDLVLPNGVFDAEFHLVETLPNHPLQMTGKSRDE